MCAFALDRRDFALEPGQAARLLGGGGGERVAARIEIGDGGLRFGKRGLGGAEVALGARPPPLGRDGSGLVGERALGERNLLGGELLGHFRRVGDQRLLAFAVAHQLRDAALQLALALARPLFLRLETLARDDDAMQRRPALRLFVAQARQSGGGDRLPRGGLGLRRGALGDCEQVGVELAARLGEGGLVLAPGDKKSQRLVAADVGGDIAVAAAPGAPGA